jgi:PAS domain S-box-containing protein
MPTKLELYQKVTPMAQLGIWEKNLITGELYCNSVMREVYEGELDFNIPLEKTIEYYTDQAAVRELFSKVILTKGIQTGNFQIITLKGNLKWVKVRAQGTFEGEKCTSFYGTLEDVTEQVNLVNTLAEREERFHRAFDYAPIGMAIVSPTGGWIKINNSLMQLLGYTEEEFLKHTFQDFTHPKDLDLDLQQMHQLLDGKIDSYSMEKRYFHKDSHVIWVQLNVSLVRSQAGGPLYFISQIRDITERKRYTEELLRERQRLDNIIKSTHVGTWEWDIPTDAVVCNKRAAAILGYTLDEIGPPFMKTWHELIHPDDREINIARLEYCFSRNIKFYASECRMRRKDGKYMWVEIRGKVISWSAGNKPLLMLGTYADIHDRKSMEQELKRTLEIISGQNGRLLNFAHIVSHNLRSHTGNMQMLLDMLIQEKDEAEKNSMMQMLIVNATNLQQTLTHLNQVVDVQGSSGHNYKHILLYQEVERTLETLSQLLKKAGATVTVNMDKAIEIEYNPAYLESILLNLITNSIKYRQPNRKLQVIITATRLSHSTIIEVKDNGLGIDMAQHGDKLFGMYKTFHGNEDARGIGLFLVKNQVEAMGGTITVESEAGVGTAFKIEFVENIW